MSEKVTEKLQRLALQRRRLERQLRALEQRLSASGHNPQLRRELERIVEALAALDLRRERLLSEAGAPVAKQPSEGDGDEQRTEPAGINEEENSGR